jgi:hypothetical protein
MGDANVQTILADDPVTVDQRRPPGEGRCLEG